MKTRVYPQDGSEDFITDRRDKGQCFQLWFHEKFCNLDSKIDVKFFYRAGFFDVTLVNPFGKLCNSRAAVRRFLEETGETELKAEDFSFSPYEPESRRESRKGQKKLKKKD